jgi:hypothetical protein
MTEYKMPEMVEIDEAIEQLNNAIAKFTEAIKKVEDDKWVIQQKSIVKTMIVSRTEALEIGVVLIDTMDAYLSLTTTPMGRIKAIEWRRRICLPNRCPNILLVGKKKQTGRIGDNALLNMWCPIAYRPVYWGWPVLHL